MIVLPEDVPTDVALMYYAYENQCSPSQIEVMECTTTGHTCFPQSKAWALSCIHPFDEERIRPYDVPLYAWYSPE